MTNVFMQVLQFLLVRGFRFSPLMSSETRLASSSELESEEVAFKCYFCDIIFLSVKSLFRHKKFYCPKRRPLPISCTATTSMLSNVASSNGELAPPGNSSSQLFKWTIFGDTASNVASSNGELAPPGNSSSQLVKWTFADTASEACSNRELAPPGSSSNQLVKWTFADIASDSESDFDVDISPPLEFHSYLAQCFMGGYYAENLATAAEGKFPARCAKRKRQSSEQESDMEVRPSSPKKRDNTASFSYPRHLLFDAFSLENEL